MALDQTAPTDELVGGRRALPVDVVRETTGSPPGSDEPEAARSPGRLGAVTPPTERR